VSSLEGVGRLVGTVFPATPFVTICGASSRRGPGFADLWWELLSLTLAYPVILGVCVLLLALSVGATFLPIGGWRHGISIGVGFIKAALVLWFFMKLRTAGGLARLSVLGTLLFLMALILLVWIDYASRSSYRGSEIMTGEPNAAISPPAS